MGSTRSSTADVGTASADASASGAELDRRFVHLHLHSEYSLLDGGNRLDRLVARVKELGMEAVAITDHGNLHAAAQLCLKAKSAGIKPILGVEAYVCPPGRSRTDRTHTGQTDGGYHLVLLAENDTGWQNLLHLCSQAYLTGFYYKPRMDREILEQFSSGLIAINGHLGSEIGDHLLEYQRSIEAGRPDDRHWERAVESARWHQRVFADEGTGPRLYCEMQHHVPEQNSINGHVVRLARENGIPLVCDNDAHFLTREDHDAHDTLVCISMGKAKSEQARLRYSPELYVKSPAEMWEIFGSAAYNNDRLGRAGIEALRNTVSIAQRCTARVPFGQSHAPVVRVVLPEPSQLPRHDAAEFGGDLSAWHRAFSARFELRPFAADEGADDTERARVTRECDRALAMLAEAGMVWRYGPEVLDRGSELHKPKWDRLQRELGVLASKLISAYFLIVWDFVNWGRQRGIPAIARGSGVGTMVGYVLGLSNACPVRYGLLFERFADPDRSEYPDIDIDLCQDGRGEVIEHVRTKYGHVAQIITFGTLKARAAMRDVARVLGISLPAADRLAKLVPEQLNITIDQALAQEPELADVCAGKPAALAKINSGLMAEDLVDAGAVAALIDQARRLEGQARHASVHAAGVIVATRPLHEIVPLYKQPAADEREVVTQWDGPTCEKVGLLKMDFLGLRTLSVIERCKQLVRETMDARGIAQAVGGDAFRDGVRDGGLDPLDLDRLSFEDHNVFAVFARGDTTGVFQFESGGMRRLLVEMRPDRLEDLIAANALFRPGPMDLIPQYNARKHGREAVPSVHEIVDRHTAETYGVMVYQEQVMQIVHELGGIPLRAAYSLIKAISKKKEKEIAEARPVFVQGAQGKGLGRKQAEDLFELILKFAGYGFNKSHSTGYAIVAYQTAYLKAYFPAQYMAAFLTYESAAQKVADWIPYLEDARRTRVIRPSDGAMLRPGLEILPPDVNFSRAGFHVDYAPGAAREPAQARIRIGLGAIKGVADRAIGAIIEERDGAQAGGDGTRAQARPFASIFDLCERLPGSVVPKAMLESLVKCGAMDSMHGREKRAAVLATIPRAVSAGQSRALDRASGQGGLFGGGGEGGGATEQVRSVAPESTPLDPAQPWTERQTLEHEREAIGFFVSSHPLAAWGPWLRALKATRVAELEGVGERQRVLLAAVCQSVRTIVVRKGDSAGQKMAIVAADDGSGTCECVVFADAFALYGHLLASDAMVLLLGEVDTSRGSAQIVVDRVLPIDTVPLERVSSVDVLIDGAGMALAGANGHLDDGEFRSADGDPMAVEKAWEVLRTAAGGSGVVAASAEAPPAVLRVFVSVPGRDKPVPIPMAEGWRVPPTPALMQQLEPILGPGRARISGKLMQRPAREQKPWQRKVPVKGKLAAG